MIFQNKLAESLQAFSNNIAIEQENESITFKQVSDAANAVGAFLLKRQPAREAVIGICVKNRVHMIYAMIGIANAGCVFAPIDAELPAKRLGLMLNDLQPAFIITEKGCQLDLPGEQLPELLFIEDILNSPGTTAVNWPTYKADDSLYVYFTSGTTGNPKGIVGKNCSLLHFLQWEISEFAIPAGYRFSQFVSPYFDAFLRDVFVPLLSGGTICIPPQQEDSFSVDKLALWIDAACINLIHCVPSVFRHITSQPLTTELFLSLNYILLSGERINPAELKVWYETFGQRIQLVNLYGPTEATMISSYYRITTDDVNKARISIGGPIHDTQLLVANKNMKPCNFLEPGDLYIISGYLSKGYLNSPELTSSRFISITIGQEKKPAFKTGDKARVFPGGNIDLIGREDRQVKVRGIRIELEEVEYSIMQSGLANGAVVIKHTDETGNEMLIAFLIKKDKSLDRLTFQNSIRSYLSGCLPAYMIPSDTVELDSFPLLRNGKINYNKLPDYLVKEEVVAPANETESRLLALWKEILGDKPVSTEDIFYKIGGNSLSIMRLISLIYREFSVRISLSDLFTHSSIKKQAVLIQRSHTDAVMQVPPAGIKPAYKVSAAQERLYYHYAINKESLAYNLPMIWEIDLDTDDAKIENAIRKLINRHEGLRTSFELDNGEIVQAIHDRYDFELKKKHITDINIDALIAENIRPFELNKPPLIRCTILEKPGVRKILMADLPHIICDGISQQLLYTDFLKLYNGEEPVPPGVQPKDYAEWEAGYRAHKAYLVHREFWLKNFDGEIPKLRLPVWHSRNAGPEEDGGIVTFFISKAIIKQLTSQLTNSGITDFSVLLSLYLLYLSQLTGQDDIVVAIASSGRLQHGLQHTIGMFAKTLPIRYKIELSRAYSNYVSGLHNYLQQAYSHQLYDLADIVESLGIKDASERTLFDTMFVFHNYSPGNLQNAGRFTPHTIHTTAAKYALSLIVSEEEERFGFRLEYANACFTEKDALLLAGRFEQLVSTVAANPHSPIIAVAGDTQNRINITTEDIVFNF